MNCGVVEVIWGFGGYLTWLILCLKEGKIEEKKIMTIKYSNKKKIQRMNRCKVQPTFDRRNALPQNSWLDTFS